MKNIMYAALASVMLMSCMKNQQIATPSPSRESEPEWADNSRGRDPVRADLLRDEDAVKSIRRSLAADLSIPTNGKNVKLIVADGAITLQGVVKSEQEKAAIESMTRQYSGAKQIDNQLEVMN